MKQLILLSLLAATSSLAAPGLTKSAVRSLVQPTESSVKSCAQAAGVHGTLKVRFDVKADGSVANFTSLAPHNGDAAAKCAEDAITAIKFPESSKGRHSKYRFQLGGAGAAVSNGVASAFHDDAGVKACTGKGTAKVSFTVGADGTPSGVTSKNQCLADAVSKMHFPTQPKPKKFSESVKLSGG